MLELSHLGLYGHADTLQRQCGRRQRTHHGPTLSERATVQEETWIWFLWALKQKLPWVLQFGLPGWMQSGFQPVTEQEFRGCWEQQTHFFSKLVSSSLSGGELWIQFLA